MAVSSDRIKAECHNPELPAALSGSSAHISTIYFAIYAAKNAAADDRKEAHHRRGIERQELAS